MEDRPRKPKFQPPFCAKPHKTGIAFNKVTNIVSEKVTQSVTDDIFLNRAGLVAAGLDAADIVLGYSAARP